MSERMKSFSVCLPESTISRIDHEIGPKGNRAEWIRIAIEERLRRVTLTDAVREALTELPGR